MPDHAQITVTGEVTDIFAHRFVVKTDAEKLLADLGPKGAKQVALCEGDKVTLSGERKPSEIKVHSLQKAGGPAMRLEHGKPHPHPAAHEDIDPKHALETVARNGFSVAAAPRRKPKHFEILGKDSAEDFVELHIELDGALRKSHRTTKGDPKWASELGNHS
jgi:hypothetical protein